MFRLLASLLVFTLLNANAELVERQKVLMGTFVTISVDDAHSSLIESAFALLKNIDDSLSTFNKNSPIYRLNHNKSAKVNAYAYEALTLSLQYYKDTDGYFDIAVGRITKDLYRFGLDERVASTESLKQACTAISGLIFNKDEAIITDTIKIDLGGMGKGFGVDKVYGYLKKNGVKHAVIALSGDIRCIGKCPISVNDPLCEGEVLATFNIQNSGVSTSGNYNRYVKDKAHNHLINPKKKSSETNFISVTLIGQLPSATLDAYATAVSVMPKPKAYEFLDAQNLAYIILESNKQLVLSKNLVEYVQDLKLK